LAEGPLVKTKVLSFSVEEALMLIYFKVIRRSKDNSAYFYDLNAKLSYKLIQINLYYRDILVEMFLV
jgi:hypothetical protein